MKIYSIFLSVFLLFSACKKDQEIPVTGISIDPTELLLPPGERSILTASIFPDNAGNKTIIWSSSNPDVAIVDAEGKVTSISIGSAVLIATTECGGKTATCTVTVPGITTSGIILDPTELILLPGENSTLTAIVIPDNATNKGVTWSSSNPDVATVDNGGKVTAVSIGTATIIATAECGGKTAVCSVIVPTIPTSGVSLNHASLVLLPGSKFSLEATVLPLNATCKDINWFSSDPSIVSVNNEGVITAVAEGNAVVVVTTKYGGKTATCSVTITTKQIKMTSLLKNVRIGLTGRGALCIHWGDGSIEMLTMSNLYTIYPHGYSVAGREITVIAENIFSINCSGQLLTKLDVSRQSSLIGLECDSHELTNLDISNNARLEYLSCMHGRLTSLDVSKNISLRSLHCGANKMTDLTVDRNTALTSLWCFENPINQLDVRENTGLLSLRCWNNQLTDLDVSKNSKLSELACDFNQLSSLDVSNNPALTSLGFRDNTIENLDVSNNTALYYLSCQNNRLSANSLNSLFESLHGNQTSSSKSVYIFGNPGTNICNSSIATSKGWVVNTYTN